MHTVEKWPVIHKNYRYSSIDSKTFGVTQIKNTKPQWVKCRWEVRVSQFWILGPQLCSKKVWQCKTWTNWYRSNQRFVQYNINIKPESTLTYVIWYILRAISIPYDCCGNIPSPCLLGSTFSKAKPVHGWFAVLRKGLLHVCFYPLYYRW